jgi:hypothetical protein
MMTGGVTKGGQSTVPVLFCFTHQLSKNFESLQCLLQGNTANIS